MSRLAIFAGYFALLLVLALPCGLATPLSWELWWNQQLYTFYPTDTAKDIVNLFGCHGGDQTWFAKAAILMATHSFTDSDYWILALFAPGLTLIESVLLKLFGLNCPIVLCLAIITCAAWAFVLFNLHELAKFRMQSIWSYLAPALMCMSFLWRQYCLQNGILLTETLSIAFLASSFLLLLRAVPNTSIALAIWSGVLMALAAYLRTQAEMIGTSLSLLTILLVLAQLLIHFIKANRSKPASAGSANFLKKIRLLNENRSVLIFFVVAVLAFNCLTAPYRLWNFYKFHNLSWLQVDYYWKMGWAPESDLAKTNDTWIIRGGIMAPSYVNPELAAKIRQNLKLHGENAYSASFYRGRTITSFLRHPVKWITFKARLLPWFWFAAINSHSANGISNQLEHLENWIYVTIIILCLINFLIVPAIRRTISDQEAAYALFYSGILLASSVMFIFVHFEPRYFYTIKLVSTIMLLSYLIEKKSTAVPLLQSCTCC